jgi:hypothetical protein
VAAKAVIKAFYAQSPKFSYFDGCSSGGRAALHEAQRFPDDYNGILAGSPTIDNTSENTFLHSWNVAPKVKFTVRMPTQNWTQRLVTVGCGGY